MAMAAVVWMEQSRAERDDEESWPCHRHRFARFASTCPCSVAYQKEDTYNHTEMDVDVDGDGIAQGSLDGEDGGGKAMGTGKGKGTGRSSEYEDELLMLERLARGETGAR